MNDHREKRVKVPKKGDFTFTIGTGPECQIRLTNEFVSGEHAQIRREGDRLFIRDCNSKNGTYVNNRAIGSRWGEITLNQRVLLGGGIETGSQIVITPELLLGRDRVGIDAQNLYYSIPDRRPPENEMSPRRRWVEQLRRVFWPKRRVLTHNVSLSAEPGTITAVMGPSGAGKTVLLNLLSGYLKPEAGRVYVDNFNVHTHFGLLKDIIGYVPQDDTLIPELTVQQSLHYCLRLQYPDMEYGIRQEMIDTVLNRMGFKDSRFKDLLATRIGSPEKRGLSGGERKRINIAHELVRKPLLLFLDEPTSGLSSIDSEKIILLLRELSQNNRDTILMTIHQPSEKVYNNFDNLLLLAKKETKDKETIGGITAYFGTTQEAVPYFENLVQNETQIGEATNNTDASPESYRLCGDRNPADYVLEVLDNWPLFRQPDECYNDYMKRKQADATADPPGEEETKPRRGRFGKRRRHSLHRQFALLLERNLRVKLADKTSLLLILFQAVLIAGLLVLTFQGYDSDHREFDRFARIWHRFQSEAKRAVDAGKTRFIEDIFEEARDMWAKKAENQKLHGESTAQGRASFLYLMVAAALWFGIVNASREIVSEKSILKRETKGPLRILPYLCAKFAVLALIAALQTGLLLLLVMGTLGDITRGFEFWLILTLSAMAASSLSLMVSAIVHNPSASLAMIPILIIPQLLLGGLIRPIRLIVNDGISIPFTQKSAEFMRISDLILQKWSFKALITCDAGMQKSVLVHQINIDHPDFMHYYDFVRRSSSDLFFDSGRIDAALGLAADGTAVVAIFIHMLVPLVVAYLCLKRKYG